MDRLGGMEREIFMAIPQGNEGRIATLLTADMTLLERVDRMGNTPLIAAAHHGGLGVLNLLVQSGSNLAATRCDARTALHVAAMMGHERAVAFLLREGAQASCRDAQGMTPLMMASTTGPMGMVRSLVRHMAQHGLGLEQSDAKGWTAVHWTAWGNHEEAAAFLLREGAQATCRDNTGMTPLMLASSQGQMRVVRALAQHMGQEGMGLEQMDAKGRTALHLAAAKGHAGVIRILLKNGAHATCKMSHDMTPLLVASHANQMPAVRVLLSVLGEGELDAADTRGATALYWAAKSGCEEIVRLLLLHGADPSIETRQGETPLAAAQRKERATCVAVFEVRSTCYAL
jgi:ankyrin repeat protein